MNCCICKGKIEIEGTWKESNNANPIKDGRCCDKCKSDYVIPARIQNLLKYSNVSGNSSRILSYIDTFDLRRRKQRFHNDKTNQSK